MNAQTQISTPASNNSVGLLNLESFELSQRIAKMLSSSTLVPEQYRATIKVKSGKDDWNNQLYREEPNPNGLSNCIIALNMSNRMGADPLMIMQNLYLIEGRPAWSSQFIMAAINTCGRFSSLRFEFEDLGEKEVEYQETTWVNRKKQTTTKKMKIQNHTCYAWVIEKGSVNPDGSPVVLKSSVISMEMAVKEGWYQKSGSKWQTMPEQMLRYRAASFFGRVYAPELLMGLRSVDEEQDRMIDVTPGNDAPVIVEKDTQPVKELILKAKTIDELDDLNAQLEDFEGKDRKDLEKLLNAQYKKFAEPKKPAPKAVEATVVEAENVVEVKITAKPSDELRKEYSLRMNNAETKGELNELLEFVKADEHLTEAHVEYLRSVYAQCKEKFAPKTQPAETPKVDIKGDLLTLISNTKDVQSLEEVAKQITAVKKHLNSEDLQEVMLAYAQRKEMLSQADIFADASKPAKQVSYVESVIARIQAAKTQDDINAEYADPAIEELSDKERQQIDLAAGKREMELQKG